MNHIPFTILAYFLNSVSVTINKLILVKSLIDPLIYIFYISLVSLLAILILPFTKIPSPLVFILSSQSTLLWTGGAYFMFKALRSGQVQRVIPAIGTLTPLILLMMTSFTEKLSLNQIWAVGFLIAGLIFLTMGDWKGKLTLWEIAFEVISSFLFAISYILLRQAYLLENFLTVLVWSRLILVPLGLVILLTPLLRRKIFQSGSHPLSLAGKMGLIFIVGQIFGGASELLLTFSISLANPALVNSLQGTQYIFLLIFVLVLSKKFPDVFKKERALFFLAKLVGIVLIVSGLYILAFSPTSGTAKVDQLPKWGLSFSPRYAKSLGLDPEIVYLNVLNELKVKRLRLPVYWDEVEIYPDQFNFSALDFYLNEALKKKVEIILVVGYKQPRWPECYPPSWVNSLTGSEKKMRVLKLLKGEILYFKQFTNITTWQVENEPLFNWGICDPELRDGQFLKQEIDLVKALDQRPILITDAGELSLWIDPIKLSDLFGTTLYRQVWSPYFGQLTYPLPPIFYTLKDNLVRIFSANKDSTTIISELQAEPWLARGVTITEVSAAKLNKQLPINKLKGNFEYAKETNFPQIYLWGAEWWYYMEKQGYPQYLEYAKTIFSNDSQN
ncbi:DMT family transporter [Candidatus Microgenomates bacterium]|nr:DMT family transporter [Candidatus Microgenomates bacterium]